MCTVFVLLRAGFLQSSQCTSRFLASQKKLDDLLEFDGNLFRQTSEYRDWSLLSATELRAKLNLEEKDTREYRVIEKYCDYIWWMRMSLQCQTILPLFQCNTKVGWSTVSWFDLLWQERRANPLMRAFTDVLPGESIFVHNDEQSF